MARTRFRPAAGVAAATVALAAAACGDATAPVPSRVVVTPAGALAETVGTTVQFSAQVQDAQGAAVPGAEVVWSSTRTSVATVSASTGLATVAGPGSTAIRATHGSVSGAASLVVELRPIAMRKVAGDSLSARVLSAVPEDPAVRVVDASGAPIPGVAVDFQVADGGGTVSPRQALTNAQGEASARWTLGEAPGVQRLQAVSGDFQAEFVATATASLVVIGSRLPRARVGVPYREALEARYAEGPVEWFVSGGSLPRGLVLESIGVVSGQVVEEGESTFVVSVRDSAGSQANGEVRLLACGPPLELAAGATASARSVASGGCPPFLPAGDAGSFYRVALIRPSFATSLTHVPVVVTVREIGDEASKPSPGPTAAAEPRRTRPEVELPPGLAEAVRTADATSRFHERLLAQTRELRRRLGRDALLSDLGAGRAAARAQQTTPPRRISIRPYDTNRADEQCQHPAPNPAPALLLDYNAHLAIYQDSIQRETDPAEAAAARQVLDYYEAYGAETIDEYFGGVSDVDGNGRVNVVISPAVGDGIAAFVWSADMTALDSCPWSNEMELVYFGSRTFRAVVAPPEGRHYQALSTMVHEMKHVSSLYKRWRGAGFHPSWVEEGGAEIAAEASSRKALEATGGVAVGAIFTRDAYPPRSGSIISPENYGVLLRLVRMSRSYGGGPNSLTTNPGDHRHTFYGTSWHFHRFLGDAYWGAAQKAEARMFAELNDSLTPAGTSGIEQVVGTRMAVLLEEYAAAMLFSGTGAPPPLRAFQTYDFRSATWDLFRPDSYSRPDGLYPWPVTGPTPWAFADATRELELAPAGIAFFDFQSDGAGHGIEVEATVSGVGVVRVLVGRIR